MEEKKCCKIRLGAAIFMTIIAILIIAIAVLVYVLVSVKNADTIINNGTGNTLSKLENKISNNTNINNSTNQLVNSINAVTNVIEQTVQLDASTTTNVTTKTNTSSFDIVYDTLLDYLQNDYQQQANEDKEGIVINDIEVYTKDYLLSKSTDKDFVESAFDWDSGKIYGEVTYSIKYKNFDNVVFAGSGDTYENYVIESRFFTIGQENGKYKISLATGL